MTAEELGEPYRIDYECKHAVEVDGDFTWEIARKPAKGGGGKDNPSAKTAKQKDQKKKSEKRELFQRKNGKDPVLPIVASSGESVDTPQKEVEKAGDKPFELKNLKFKVPKGSFVAIVGRVGSGKVIHHFYYARNG